MELLRPRVLAEPDEHEALADEERPFDEHAVAGKQLDEVNKTAMIVSSMAGEMVMSMS